jgi:hypothetical protein
VLGASGRRAFRVLSFGIGLFIGAAATSLSLHVVRVLLAPVLNLAPNVIVMLVAACVLLLSLREIGLLRFWLPENRRLVPETVFRLGDFFGSLQFGMEMGSGARTYVSSSIPYMLVLLGFWSGHFVELMVGAIGFALGREIMTVLSVASGESSKWDDHYRAGTVWQRFGLVLFLGIDTAVLAQGN